MSIAVQIQDVCVEKDGEELSVFSYQLSAKHGGISPKAGFLGV
jgi:hypothetical protein